ncbi:glutamate--cysteine ligase 2 [Nocardia alni]|uniref:glutamate--cysteine ligase 2 n=1 Tax=Nocardia alni TaxID=2815723 RepID=UPI001C21E592|nr:glutamate--cysteine ligase [Nocardia alni]
MDVDSCTVGVEEEFLLVDRRVGAPTARNAEVAEAARAAGIDLQLELTSCQVETNTGVHTRTAELSRELRALRKQVAECAEKNEACLLAVGVPPTVPDGFPVTHTERYQRIAHEFGMLAHEQGMCGCHVHVGVPDREIAIQISNFLRPRLPLVLALTANSSIYRGSETGFASWRSILWRRWPSAGPPPYFVSSDEYDAMVAMMLDSGSILDEKMVYWDVRPATAFPTVEVRVSDVPATVEETVLLATLIRAAVLTAQMSLAEGRPAPAVTGEVLRAAYWKAARSGIAGQALDPIDGRVLPASELLAEFVDYLAPALKQLNDQAFVTDTVAAVLGRGNGAMRQTEAMRARGEVGDVIEEAARATVLGCH